MSSGFKPSIHQIIQSRCIRQKMCQLPVYIPKWKLEYHPSFFGDKPLEKHANYPFYKTVNAGTQDFFLL